jgi:hypothetical protein
MYKVAAIAKALNRPVLFLHGWQTRFELPAGKGPHKTTRCHKRILILEMRQFALTQMRGGI